MKTKEKIILDLPPVAVKFLGGKEKGLDKVRRFKGVSYCQAVLWATFGDELIVDPSSIQTCQWAPVVLGFKTAENEFEKSINRTLPAGAGPVYLARVDTCRKRFEPDVVLVRAPKTVFYTLIEALGDDAFISCREHRLDETALSVFAGGPLKGFSRWAVRNINRWLYWMNGFAWWQKVTTFLFRSTVITSVFDRFITRYMANMSMCRNSTVLPFQTGRANISFFCTGGVAWGKNPYDFMTSGFPVAVFKKIEGRLRYPGHPGYGHESPGAAELRERMLRHETPGAGAAR